MFICSFVLQFQLVKKDNPWYSIILPIISFLLATFLGLGALIHHRKLGLDVVLKDFLFFSSLNFATIVYLIMFFVCRKIKPEATDKTTDKTTDKPTDDNIDNDVDNKNNKGGI